ncbi:MAG TPA: hypothetical protein VEU33_03080 [Archangium sp.]|nr:hypothetical protein [Archangium sp.]
MRMPRHLLLLPVLVLLCGCNLLAPRFARWTQNVDLKKERGIHLEYRYVPRGLYSKVFRIPFSDYLKEMSNGQLQLDAINTYTVGSYKQSPTCKHKLEYSNFIDPECRFVNAWFGVYLIFDDTDGRGRGFMLKDAKADPTNPDNFRPESIRQVPELDQKLIVYSTHEGQRNYGWEDFEKDFRFVEVSAPQLEQVTDAQGRIWLKQTGAYETIAALTDTKKTKMELFSSIRVYTGLPTEEVYRQVDPWYPMVIKGSVLARYFDCPRSRFWALAYYNGSAFTRKDGTQVDTYADPGLVAEYERAFQQIELECAQ